jgi:hypothetical protein
MLRALGVVFNPALRCMLKIKNALDVITNPQRYELASIGDDTVNADECDVRLAAVIKSSYEKMASKIKTVEDVYKPGSMWKGIINDNKKDFYASLFSGDINKLANVFANFFRTSAITGFWEGGAYKNFSDNPNKRRSFIEATGRCYDFWKVVMNQQVEVVELPDVGNPWGCKIENSIVSTAQFKLHYHASQVYNLVKDEERPVVLEIGGGFGGLGYYLFKMGFKGVYLNFDLPESLILSEYFLMKSFKEKNTLIYDGQNRLSSEDMDSHDIILMPNFMLKDLPELSVDLVVNTRSFSEMPYNTVDEYMSQIDKVCTKYFYHDNANIKSHEFELPADEFPIPDSFKLLMKAKSLWYGGPLPNRFVEYLYEKSAPEN